MTHFGDLLAVLVPGKDSILCVGIDPDIELIPEKYKEKARHADYLSRFGRIRAVFTEFGKNIVDAVAPHAIAVKPNIAFYECYGAVGLEAYEEIVAYARQCGLIVIGDVKRGDGGPTARAYANGHIGLVKDLGPAPGEYVEAESTIRVDAATVNAYPGEACIDPFVEVLKESGAGIFVVAKTSFKPESIIEQLVTRSGHHLWEEVASCAELWGEDTGGESGYRSVGAVLGATFSDPRIAWRMRKLLPKSWLLVPGYGAQGASAVEAVQGVNEDGLGILVNSSSAIIYADDPGLAAETCKLQLNIARRMTAKYVR